MEGVYDYYVHYQNSSFVYLPPKPLKSKIYEEEEKKVVEEPPKTDGCIE